MMVARPKTIIIAGTRAQKFAPRAKTQFETLIFRPFWPLCLFSSAPFLRSLLPPSSSTLLSLRCGLLRRLCSARRIFGIAPRRVSAPPSATLSLPHRRLAARRLSPSIRHVFPGGAKGQRGAAAASVRKKPAQGGGGCAANQSRGKVQWTIRFHQ